MATGFLKSTEKKPCSEPDCDNEVLKDDLCVNHYKEKKDLERQERKKKPKDPKEDSEDLPDEETPQTSESTPVSVENNLVVKITKYETKGENTYFVVEAERGSEGVKVSKYRYSEFAALNEQIVGFYKRHHKHLVGNLPPLPPRQARLLADHKSSDFIEKRRVALQSFLQALVVVPHAQDNPLLFQFLGLGLPPKARLKLKEGEKLTAVRISKAETKDKTTFFYIEALTSPSKEVTQTLKRYSDFESFDERIRNAYTDLHPTLVKSLPELPQKRPRLLEDHQKKEFVEQRRLLLQSYLVKLLKVEHAADNPHVWKFLGLVDYAYYEGKVDERLRHPEERTTPTASPASSPSSSFSPSSFFSAISASVSRSSPASSVSSSPAKSSTPISSGTAPASTSSISTFTSAPKSKTKTPKTKARAVEEDENDAL